MVCCVISPPFAFRSKHRTRIHHLFRVSSCLLRGSYLSSASGRRPWLADTPFQASKAERDDTVGLSKLAIP